MLRDGMVELGCMRSIAGPLESGRRLLSGTLIRTRDEGQGTKETELLRALQAGDARSLLYSGAQLLGNWLGK